MCVCQCVCVYEWFLYEYVITYIWVCILSTIKLKVQTSEWFDVDKDFLVMILSSQDNK